MDDPDNPSAKRELREELLTARRARSVAELVAARTAVRDHVLRWLDDSPDVTCVAGYVPLRTEPGSVELLAELAGHGLRVLVPVTLPDHDLDWTVWGADGSALGVDAVRDAHLVLVPALAVTPDGMRLGRGGGSYDRALRRVDRRATTVAVIFDEELRPELPRDPWDVPVGAAVMPAGWRLLRP